MIVQKNFIYETTLKLRGRPLGVLLQNIFRVCLVKSLRNKQPCRTCRVSGVKVYGAICRPCGDSISGGCGHETDAAHCLHRHLITLYAAIYFRRYSIFLKGMVTNVSLNNKKISASERVVF